MYHPYNTTTNGATGVLIATQQTEKNTYYFSTIPAKLAVPKAF